MPRRLSIATWFLAPAALVLAGGCGLNTAGESPGDTVDVPTEGFDGDVDIPDDARDRGDGEIPDVPDGSDGDADDGDTGPECGDGIVEGTEECDQGPANSNTAPGACRTSCRWFFCGDNVVDPGEACDDGNTVGGDGCEADCSLITCGNGRVEGTEECDDGNSDNTDACLTTCVFATCGDGFVWADHEVCDRTPGACTASCGSSGLRACVACAWSADCTPPGESCNALDDDCVDGPDNGFDCVIGSSVDCLTTCDSTGLGACTATCTIPAPVDCVPPGETCNGADDDCDMTPDNGFDCVLGATRSCPACTGVTGTQSCGAACSWGACTPPAESCNGSDDDCDTAPDNGFACALGATRSCSACAGSTGTQTCDAGCSWGACTPPAESCNGSDDDCDGLTDEGFDCARGATRVCTACAGTSGTQTCGTACTWGACTPPAEICNATDDDCDTAIDETFACVRGSSGSCDTACGPTGTHTCDTTCAWGACTPPAETCNAIDDDCDTATDETFACVQNSTGTCTTSCGSTGTHTCSATCAWGTCNAPAEVCNGRDDDCDGSTDEGLGVCNDTCANAIDISALGSVNGTTAGAADDNNRCTTAGCGTGGRDVWYRFTLAAREVVYLGLQDGQTWDAVLDVRSGACGSTSNIACNDDACGNARPHSAGSLAAGTYYVVVDACGTDNGAFTMTYQHSPCPGALAIAAPGTVSGDSCGDGADTSGSCGGGSSEELPYFFPLCPGSRTVSADDCGDGQGWSAAVYIRRGSGGTCGGTEVDCGGAYSGCGITSPRASASGTVTGPGLVFVVQDGWSILGANRCGPFDLDVSW